MYISCRETLSNEWTPSAVCESCADWLKFEDLSNRDQQVPLYYMATIVRAVSNVKFDLDLGVIEAKIVSFSKKLFLLSLLVSIARPGFSLFSEHGLQ